MEKNIELYPCDGCDKVMSLKAIGFSWDEQTLCDDCFNGAICRAENAYDASMGR